MITNLFDIVENDLIRDLLPYKLKSLLFHTDRIYAFRAMLDKLGQHLDATHVKRIVDLEDLTTREKGEIQNSPAALFQLLESKQKLNVDDVSRLKENLQTIDHMAAVKLLDEYQHRKLYNNIRPNYACLACCRQQITKNYFQKHCMSLFLAEVHNRYVL